MDDLAALGAYRDIHAELFGEGLRPRASGDDHVTRFDLLTVDGHTDVDRRSPDRPPARTRMIMPLEEVVFPRPGRYSFRVRVKGRTFQGPPLYLMDTGGAEGAVPSGI